MPVHDWSRVEDGDFHHFHSLWIGTVSSRLNADLLPEGYYCLAEAVASEAQPDVLTLARRRPPATDDDGGGVATLAAPSTRIRQRAAPDARPGRRIAIRHTGGDRVVALVEIVSRGNKRGLSAWQGLLAKLTSALRQGVNLLVIDLHRPTARDPQGLHVALWEGFSDEPTPWPADKPLTLAAYACGPGGEVTAYAEPVAVGDRLPDMPLFLDGELHVEVPLEETYAAAYVGVPRHTRRILEAP